MQQEKDAKRPWEKILARWKNDRRALYALYGVLLLAALAFYFAGTDRLGCAQKTRATNAVEPVGVAQKRDELEQRLIAVLSQIRGAGRVDVLVTYETAGEIVTAMSSRTEEDVRDAVSGKESTTSRSTSSVTEPATVKSDGGQTPIVLVEREPVVRGVIVVAEGAADLTVRLNLQRAVQAATGVLPSQIEVFEMTYGS